MKNVRKRITDLCKHPSEERTLRVTEYSRNLIKGWCFGLTSGILGTLYAMQCKWPAILGGDLDTLYFVLILNENNKVSDYLSRFTFIASDYELPEIDLSGIIKGTVKELREMNLNPRPELSFNLDKLRDDIKAIFIPDGIDTGGLQISTCTNPPDGTEENIKKRYIYWLGGSFGINWKNQLKEYLITNIQEGNPIELWSIWFGWNEFEAHNSEHFYCHLGGGVAYAYNWAFLDIQRINGQEYLNESTSPNGAYTVTAYLNNGGATVDYAVLGRLKNNRNGKTKNIYWQYHCEKAEMEWVNDEMLKINDQQLNVKNEIYDYRRK